MISVRLLKSFSDLYTYCFGKACHPLRLLKTVRLLETLEYTVCSERESVRIFDYIYQKIIQVSLLVSKLSANQLTFMLFKP